MTHNGHWLFAVNAASNSVSVFRVRRSGRLTLVDVAPSGGTMPTSLTVYNYWLYVLNNGAGGNIAGLKMRTTGVLVPISGSEQPFSNNGTGTTPSAPQISFNPAGTLLVVTEKTTNLIDTYKVNSHGRAMAPVTHASAGVTPNGFAFSSHTTLVVSEAQGGATGAAQSPPTLSRPPSS